MIMIFEMLLGDVKRWLVFFGIMLLGFGSAYLSLFMPSMQSALTSDRAGLPAAALANMSDPFNSQACSRARRGCGWPGMYGGR